MKKNQNKNLRLKHKKTKVETQKLNVETQKIKVQTKKIKVQTQKIKVDVSLLGFYNIHYTNRKTCTYIQTKHININNWAILEEKTHLIMVQQNVSI